MRLKPAHSLTAGALAVALVAISWCGSATAQPRPLLHPLFSDHAVLQRDRPMAVWGWAQPRERVIVSFANERAEVRADATGAWRAALPALRAGGPFTLEARTASGASERASDLLVGDVYLCSGQSNMEFPARGAAGGAGDGDERIRLFKVPLTSALRPQSVWEMPTQWQQAQGAAIDAFSAVCYFFGREIRGTVDVPIGLIQSAWGGTRIESWLSAAALRGAGGFEDGLAAFADAVADPGGARARYRAALAEWWMQSDPGARAGWSSFAFDDSDWSRVTLAGNSWEHSDAAALAAFDGAVWFRTEFTLTPEQAAQATELTLGPIDDIDLTSVNGAVVGGESNWQAPRAYTLPIGTLRAGRNTLAVGVLDTIGGGGLWGGPETRALHFADGSSLAMGETWRYRISADLWNLPPPPPHAPWDGHDAYTSLYNAMIAPLAPFGLRGVLWYQGESNVAAPDDYARLLPALMRDWRAAFAAPELPFLVVQLANYGAPSPSSQRKSWGGLRDVQRRVVAADAHAGLAVSVDIGDRFDIHPTQKLVLAQRLARIARRLIYSESIADSGPTPVFARRVGDTVVVTFAHGPLIAYSAARPIAFELCDAQRSCRFVDASIRGVEISLDARGLDPAFVRYCWGDAPVCNLYNDADLPAVPFEAPVAR